MTIARLSLVQNSPLGTDALTDTVYITLCDVVRCRIHAAVLGVKESVKLLLSTKADFVKRYALITTPSVCKNVFTIIHDVSASRSPAREVDQENQHPEHFH